jgi:hypothetical protein
LPFAEAEETGSIRGHGSRREINDQTYCTVRVKVVEWLIVPEVPFTVSVAVPLGVFVAPLIGPLQPASAVSISRANAPMNFLEVLCAIF